MRGNAYDLLFYAAIVWILFAFTEGSVVTLHTQEGCNATLLCNQKGNVTWLDSDTSQKIEDPRFQTRAFGFFSTLFITDVSRNDGGNITCVGQERNTTISIEVCFDAHLSPSECVSSVQNGDLCTSRFMKTKCKKSCNLCPEPNCTETVLPVIPTTENPQTTSVTSEPNCTETVLPVIPTTGNSQTTSAGSETSPTQDTTDSTESTSTTEDDVRVSKNSGSSWRSGFRGPFALVSALFSILVIISQNITRLPTLKPTRSERR